MERLIDAKALSRQISTWQENFLEGTAAYEMLEDVLSIIDDAPTIAPERLTPQQPKKQEDTPMENPNRNAEHYADPTPAAAMKNICRDEAERLRKISSMMATLKQAADLAGLEVVGRVVFRDKSTGKEYR